MVDSVSPDLTVYVVAADWPAACRLSDTSCAGVCPTRPRMSYTLVCCVGVLMMAGLAIAGGEMHTAAATPASTGAAAADSRREIRYRDVLLWAPKGLLSEQGALSWEGLATCTQPSRAPDSSAA